MHINPFASSGSKPGEGIIALKILPPATPVLETLSYQYPLKLIAPSPLTISAQHGDGNQATLVYTVFLLTYGGGLVAGDAVSLSVTLAATTRLVLLTQGSTKIFKSPDVQTITRQHMTVDIGHEAAFVYLPDPVCPFGSSAFEQRQVYSVTSADANLCVCDWVCEGRSARGEKWSFRNYASRNEVWLAVRDGTRRLLLRDNVFLDSRAVANEGLLGRMEDLGVFGTLILCGSMFSKLAVLFLAEFRLLPRIGNRQWDELTDVAELSEVEKSRLARLLSEKMGGVIWTVAETRGFTVVKFGAKEVEGAKRWLRTMLEVDGTIEKEFGEGALLCLR